MSKTNEECRYATRQEVIANARRSLQAWVLRQRAAILFDEADAQEQLEKRSLGTQERRQWADKFRKSRLEMVKLNLRVASCELLHGVDMKGVHAEPREQFPERRVLHENSMRGDGMKYQSVVFYGNGNTETRSVKQGECLCGTAAVFDQWSVDLGGFREKISPAAFTNVIYDKTTDVRCLRNHSSV